MVGTAESAASAPPKACTAPLLSRASPECVPGNSAASTTVVPAGRETLPPPCPPPEGEGDARMAPAASTAMTVPSLAASSRTGVGTANRGPAAPALSQVVPSVSRRSGPDARLTTSTAGARGWRDGARHTVLAQGMQRRVGVEEQRASRRWVLLPHPQYRRCAVRLRRQRSEDGAIGSGRRRAGTGRKRLVENDGRRGVPGRVPDRESKLVGGAGVAEEAHGSQRLASQWLVGTLSEPRAEGEPLRADLDRDILDAGELIVPRPVKAQGASQRWIDVQRRGGRVD